MSPLLFTTTLARPYPVYGDRTVRQLALDVTVGTGYSLEREESAKTVVCFGVLDLTGFADETCTSPFCLPKNFALFIASFRDRGKLLVSSAAVIGREHDKTNDSRLQGLQRSL
jgi:hypothetical protein